MTKSEKVTITIEQEEGYTSVRFNGRRYGSSSPCSNEEEVRSAIASHKAWIEREGDTWKVEDTRKKQGLFAFTGEVK